MTTFKLPGMRPRNPVATAARKRAAGAHDSGSRKAERRDRRVLREQLRSLEDRWHSP